MRSSNWSIQRTNIVYLTAEGIKNVYICWLSKKSALFFVTIDNETNAKTILATMLAWREQQNLNLIDSLVLDGEIEWHKNFLNS